MVEEADAAALAVKLLLMLGCHDHQVVPPENWLRLVRLCALLLAELRAAECPRLRLAPDNS